MHSIKEVQALLYSGLFWADSLLIHLRKPLPGRELQLAKSYERAFTYALQSRMLFSSTRRTTSPGLLSREYSFISWKTTVHSR